MCFWRKSLPKAMGIGFLGKQIPEKSQDVGKCLLEDPYLRWNMYSEEVSFGEIVSMENRLLDMLLQEFHPWYSQGGTLHYAHRGVTILRCEGIHYLLREGNQPPLSLRKPLSWKFLEEMTYKTHTTFKYK
jgi:hypothetical protein